MICAQCSRPLQRPAARVGRLVFGPTCARRLGLLAPPSVRHALFDLRRAAHDDRTPDLFENLETHK